MGLNKTIKSKRINLYYHYEERIPPLVEMAEGKAVETNNLFQYVLLLAIPFAEGQASSGVQISKDYVAVDLRQALPSTFLRPHAQHGIVARKKVHSDENKMGAAAYDMASSIVGIIRIRIDRVSEWMGKGDLLTQNNLFRLQRMTMDMMYYLKDAICLMALIFQSLNMYRLLKKAPFGGAFFMPKRRW